MLEYYLYLVKNDKETIYNIDSGYFAGKKMVGDPVDTNMNFQDIEKQWGSTEVYREARARFIVGMTTLLEEFDSAIIGDDLIMSETLSLILID